MKGIFIPIRFIQPITNFLSQLFLRKYIKVFEEKYILPMYVQSHSNYKLKTYLGRYWHSISNNLEVSFQMSTRFCGEPSKIEIRNNSDKSVDKVIILVEAEGCFDGSFRNEYYTKEQELVFHNIGSSPKIKYLNDIPIIDFWVLGNGNTIFSYKDFSICNISVVESGIKKVIQNKNKIIFSCQSRYLEDLYENNWQEKNGEYFHIGYINEAKFAMKRRIWSDWNSPPIWTTKKKYFWKFWKTINDLHCKFLLQDKMISIRFWLLVILNRHREDSDGYLKFDQYSLFLK